MMNKWIALYVALLASCVALATAAPGQANTSVPASVAPIPAGKLGDRLIADPDPRAEVANAARAVRVVYPSHLASAK